MSEGVGGRGGSRGEDLLGSDCLSPDISAHLTVSLRSLALCGASLHLSLLYLSASASLPIYPSPPLLSASASPPLCRGLFSSSISFSFFLLPHLFRARKDSKYGASEGEGGKVPAQMTMISHPRCRESRFGLCEVCFTN